MDAVSLPMYRSYDQDPLWVVLTDLQRRGRAGVVIEDSNDYRLLFAGELLQSQANGLVYVQQVSGGEAVLLLGNEHVAQYSVDLVRPMQTPGEYGNLFGVLSHEYVLAGATPGSAIVVTRSEDYAESLLMIGGYQCNGTPTHYFPRPRVTSGQNCPLYPACQRSDGTVPTVRPVP